MLTLLFLLLSVQFSNLVLEGRLSGCLYWLRRVWSAWAYLLQGQVNGYMSPIEAQTSSDEAFFFFFNILLFYVYKLLSRHA